MSVAILTNVVTSLGYGSIMANQYVKEDERQKEDKMFISHQIIQAMTAMTIANEVFQLGWTMARAFFFKAIAVTSIGFTLALSFKAIAVTSIGFTLAFSIEENFNNYSLIRKIVKIVNSNISVLSNITYVTSIVALAYFGNLSLALPGLMLYSAVLLSSKGLLPKRIEKVFREFMKPLSHVTLLVFGDLMTKFVAIVDLYITYVPTQVSCK